MKKKMDSLKKMVDLVLKKLNWNLVMEYYASNDMKTKAGKRYSPEAVKKELRDLIKFMMDTNASELHHDPWIIFWNPGNESTKTRLEVAFVPTKAVSMGEEIVEAEEILTEDEMERIALESLLEKNLATENYELCAVLRDRLKRLGKPLHGKDI
jgi:hypothetical protein